MKKFTLMICFSILFSLQIEDVVIGEENPIRIGYLQSDIHQLACWVAMEKGLFEKNGANAQVAGIFKAGPEEMNAFVGYVREVLGRPGEDRPGKDGSRVAIGKTESG